MSEFAESDSFLCISQLRSDPVLKTKAAKVEWIELTDASGAPYFYNFRDASSRGVHPDVEEDAVLARNSLRGKSAYPTVSFADIVGQVRLPESTRRASLSFPESTRRANLSFANQTFPDPRRSPGRWFCVFVLILMGQQRLTCLKQVVKLNPQWRVRSEEQTANLRRGLPARSYAGLESEVLNRFCALYMERRSFPLPAILPPYCLI